MRSNDPIESSSGSLGSGLAGNWILVLIYADPSFNDPGQRRSWNLLANLKEISHHDVLAT